jgi:O-antigen/teichoic acid export membrane protein
LANLTRGFSAGLLSLALPAVLIREIPISVYATWAVVLQIASYIAMLDLGLQVGIGRFFARETAREDHNRRAQFFFGGATLLGAAGFVALIVTCLIAAFLPELFPKIAPSLIPSSQLAVLLIGGSCAVSLPGSAIAAVFIGLERYDIPAIVLGGGRVLQVCVVSVCAITSHQLVTIALAYALCNLSIQFAFLVSLFRLGPKMRFGPDSIQKGILFELGRYCSTLAIWTVGMLLISGLDTTIVAEVDFKSVAAYSICANLLAIFIGLVNSAFNVLISRAAALHGNDRNEEIGRLLVQATKVCTVGTVGIALMGTLFGKPLLTLWVGERIATMAMPIYLVLIWANCVRLLLVPFASILLGTGEQRWVNWVALTEGGTNLAFSIGLGMVLGGIGVAYGTLIGAVVSFILVMSFAFRRVKGISCSFDEYLIDGILKPLSAYGPLAIGTILYVRSPSIISLTFAATGFILSALILMKTNPEIAQAVLKSRSLLLRRQTAP